MSAVILRRPVKAFLVATGAGAILAMGPVAASVAWASPLPAVPDPCSALSPITSLLPITLPVDCSTVTGALGGVGGSGGGLPDPTGVVSTVTGALGGVGGSGGGVPGLSSLTSLLGGVPGISSLTGGLSAIPGISSLTGALGGLPLGTLNAANSPSGSDPAATLAADPASSSDPSGSVIPAASAGSTLPFTGEPTWIPIVGMIAAALAGLAGLVALGLRLAARRFV